MPPRPNARSRPPRRTRADGGPTDVRHPLSDVRRAVLAVLEERLTPAQLERAGMLELEDLVGFERSTHLFPPRA